MRKPPLSALRAFESAARLGGIRKASRELMIDHAVVSRHVRDLQAELGVDLIAKASEKFQLTKQGEVLSIKLSEAFSDLYAALENIKHESSSAALKICCIHGFAQRWLLQHLRAFSDQHPDIDTKILSVDEAHEFAAAAYDVSILYGALAPSNARQRLLLRPRIHAVARPDVASAFSGNKDDFVSFIQSATLLHDGDPQQWQRWLLAATAQTPTPRKNLSFSNASICIEAALLGHGVAIANEILVQAELSEGKLVSLWPEPVFLDCYYLQISECSQHKQACKKFIDWITALPIPSGAF